MLGFGVTRLTPTYMKTILETGSGTPQPLIKVIAE
jgi:hypothetical protein